MGERAATKAYDVASSRERMLRDEMEKAASENSHGGGHDDGAENETWRRVQDAKNTADWAAGLEEQRKAHERVVEEARARLAAAEDHARDVMRQDGDEYGEFGRISEALERTKRAAAEAHEVEEARRVAAVASVDASHKLRVASERLDEMTGKMQRKERELADAERDIDAATREAQAATNEAREAEAREGELAREHAALAAAEFGGGVGGGTLNDARATYEAARDELSAMRGQLEEAKHTVMRAEELEQLRRTAAEAFERSASERAATIGLRSLNDRSRRDADPRGAAALDPTPRRRRATRVACPRSSSWTRASASWRTCVGSWTRWGTACWRRCRSTRRRTTDSRARRRGTSETVSTARPKPCSTPWRLPRRRRRRRRPRWRAWRRTSRR